MACPTAEASGGCLREVLASYFESNPAVRSYLLEDDGSVRKHVVIFIDGKPARDRQRLSDRVGTDSEVFVFQALSGG